MPTQESDTGQQASPTERRHTNPRRVSPANSITLRHHRLAREASERRRNGSSPGQNASGNGSPPRQNSSGDSHETTASDPKKWFDQSNQNPTATYSNAMDVDPPFFQRESDSSNEDPSLLYPPPRPNMLGRGTAQSSSADDYRSVIDDLTVEIQKLKEELKHYKQQGPDMLRKDKLFEIKVHGLPRRKKRELESTLRDFAAGLPGSPQSSSRNMSRRAIVHSGSGSKHASSSSGSNARPVDSAYASMSTGANSSGTSLGKSSMRKAAKASEQKVESYLRDIPEGLYPRHMAMTDKERKKIVVRRLEQLFTGKINGLNSRQNRFAVPQTTPVITETAPPSHAAECSVPQSTQKTVHHPPSLLAEPSREARILSSDRQHGHRKKSGSGDNGSASNSNGDQTESGGNGHGNGNGSGSGSGNGASSGSGTNASPPDQTPPEQRPTRPKDLDPDRVQVPSENMAYIRHLGLVPPELLPDIPQDADVSPDAEGWVYLNLLCNLAQLHMINVTPSFVRSAVSEISTKFQLSPDGRKIRWRGGTEGTKLSSESSADSSEKSPQTDDTDVIQDGVRKKRQKTGQSTEESAGTSSKQNSKFGPQVSTSSKKFHYKPLFVRQDSSRGEASMDDTLSSFGPVEESNVGGSGWGQSGSGGTTNRKKRRHDGAIIYYSGAPFCTDLSGDTGDASPATYMTSSGQDQETMETSTQSESRPLAIRSTSGSTLDHRPLSIANFSTLDYKMDIDNEDTPGITSDTGDNSTGSEMEFPWSEGQQYLDIHPLEPCGLGGVLPDDHFMVVVTTKRPKEDAQLKIAGSGFTDVTDNIICRLATMSASSPAPMLPSRKPSTSELLPTRELEIEYTSGRIKRLNPVPLPPPAIFFPPFSSGSSASEADDIMLAGDDDSDFEDSSSQELVSRQANPHHSDGYPDGHLSSGDEDGEDLDAEAEERMFDIGVTEGGLVMDPLSRLPGQSIGSEVVAPGTARGGSRSISLEAAPPNDSSSAATAGKAGSDADSSSESS